MSTDQAERFVDDGWVAAGVEELRSLEIDGEARMPVNLRVTGDN